MKQLCTKCLPALEREALFSVKHAGETMGFVCVKHAGEIRQRAGEGVKVALLPLDQETADKWPAEQVCICPPGECKCVKPAPALPAEQVRADALRRQLTPADLDELERQARHASQPEGPAFCTVTAAELLELVQSHRLMLGLGELIREFKGPRP